MFTADNEQCKFLRTILCCAILVTSIGVLAQTAPQAKAARAERELVESEFKQLLATAESLFHSKRYDESIPLLERSLVLAERIFGTEDSKVSDVLFRMAVTYQQQGDFAKALQIFQRCLALGEKLVGPEHDQIATVLAGLGMIQKEQGNFAQAIAAFSRSLAIVEKHSGRESLRVAATLNSFSLVYLSQGDFTNASLALQRSLAIREKALGSEHPDVATCLNNLGELSRLQGNYLQASNALLRSLEIRVKAFGTLHRDVATTVNNAAVLQEDLGRHDAALGLHLRALEIREKVFGPNHPDVAVSLNNLGLLYATQAQFTPALAALQRSLAISEQIAGPEHPSVATTLINLSSVYRALGDFGEAEKHIRRSLSIREKAFGGEHPEVANSLNNLAFLHKDQGAYAQAMPLLRRSLSIEERYFGLKHPVIATTLDAIASVFDAQDDYEQALQAYQRSLAISELAFGPKHRQVATTLNNLAGLYAGHEKLDEALEIQQRSLAIAEVAFGPGHPEVAATLANLAGIHSIRGNPETALPLCQRSLELREKIFGPEHRAVAVSVGLKAGLKLSLGDEVESLRLFRRAGLICERSLGLEHPETIGWLTCVAVGSRRQGEIAESESEVARLSRALRNYLSGQFSAASPTAVLRTLDALTVRDGLFHSAWADDAKLGAASASLRGAEELSLNKSLFEEIQSTQAALEASPLSTTRQLRGQFQATQADLLRLLENKLEPAQRDARRRELQAELSQLEAKLAERVSLVAQTVRERNLSLADIARSLPPQSALVDFVNYRRYDFTAKTNMWKEARYAAYVTFPPAAGTTNFAVERLDLGEAAPINAAVAELHQLFAERRIAPQRLEPVLQRLGTLLYAPLARHLTNVAHLIFCPDGQLGRLPFELLPVDSRGRRLVEDKLITYVSSGREVVRLAQPRAAVATTAPLVMGNPDFDFILPGSSRREEAPIKPGTPNAELGTNSLSLLTSAATPRQRFLSRSFRDFKFTPLPDSEHEARKAAMMLGTNCVLRLGAAARETDLKAVSSPRVLHLATHGFFLKDQEFKRTNGLAENFQLAGSFPAGGGFPSRQSFAPSGQDWENPLIRCGIALAGANRASGITNAHAEDGILTGLEAALLNLQGTELVILSACDSGSGDVKIGEGVMSLRRAFTIAGAETVLASHWKVNDAATSALMTEFMRRWQSGTPRGQAWREAQLSLLRSKDFSNPYFWAAFTLTGQWR